MILYDLKKNIYVVYRSDSEKGPGSEKRPARIIVKGEPMPARISLS